SMYAAHMTAPLPPPPLRITPLRITPPRLTAPHPLCFAEFDVAFPPISGIELRKTHTVTAGHTHYPQNAHGNRRVHTLSVGRARRPRINTAPHRAARQLKSATPIKKAFKYPAHIRPATLKSSCFFIGKKIV